MRQIQLWAIVLTVALPLHAWAQEAPFGTLTIMAHNLPGSIQPFPCQALLLTADTVLTQASCFDAVRKALQVDRSSVEAEFAVVLPGTNTIAKAAMRGYDFRLDYRPVICDDPLFANACTSARQYCMQRFNNDPMQRNACLYDQSFYARTYAPPSGPDLALVYLNRKIDTRTAAIARPLETFGKSLGLQVVRDLGEAEDMQPLRISQDMLDFADFIDARYSRGAFVQRPDGAKGLVALSSHFASLSWNPQAPIDFAFTRVDTVADWVRITMDLACRDNVRLDCTEPARIDPIPPGEPTPPNQPAPNEPPADKRPKKPAKPMPKPAPTPAPAPSQPTSPQSPSPPPEHPKTEPSSSGPEHQPGPTQPTTPEPPPAAKPKASPTDEQPIPADAVHSDDGAAARPFGCSQTDSSSRLGFLLLIAARLLGRKTNCRGL